MGNYPTWFEAAMMELDRDLEDGVITMDQYRIQEEYLLQDLDAYENG